MTPNQVANQLLQNGKPASKERGHLKKLKSEMDQALQDSDEGFEAFTTKEIDEALNHLKLGKAAGIDGIFTERSSTLDLLPSHGYYLSLTNAHKPSTSQRHGESQGW